MCTVLVANLTFNLPQLASSYAAEGYTQLQYMTGTYAIEAANPGSYKLGGDLATVGSFIQTVGGLPGESSEILKAIVNSSIEYTIQEELAKMVSNEADRTFR